MFAKINSLGLWGVEGFPVQVETDISQGLPSFEVVGLAGTAVRESRDRVRSALKNNGFTYPVSRITVNLAPADVKKEGSLYDLPLLLGVLCAGGQLPPVPADTAFVGELSLTGELRPVRGVLPMVLAARAAGFRAVVVPAANAAEGAVVDGIAVYPADHIKTLLAHLTGRAPLTPCAAPEFVPRADGACPDFSDVMGQLVPRRALEIAAAGGHNLLLIGPPGSGKSMLARRLPSILPDMTRQEALESTALHSVAGELPGGAGLLSVRPFRAPHHSVSTAGLAGGGTVPHPGEISLAHNGVLFLDELPEFSRRTMEALRQPLEDRQVTISRAGGTVSFPSSFMLVAAMNPCPCGYFGHPTHPCTCAAGEAQRYLSRISGPLLDRFDLHVDVPPVEYRELSAKATGEPSAAIRERVNAARRIQAERYRDDGILTNAQLPTHLQRRYCALGNEANTLMHQAFDRMGLSARAYDRLLKVARTIADLAGSETIQTAHLAEALQYRGLDRKYWR